MIIKENLTSMLDGVVVIFDGYSELQKRLKKKQYKERTEWFRSSYGHFFDEMNDYIDNADDKAAAMKELSQLVCSEAAKKYKKKKLFLGRSMLDLSFHMIYYIFPTIIAYEKDYSLDFAEAMRLAWNETMGENILSCADYDSLLGSFNEKILGMF